MLAAHEKRRQEKSQTRRRMPPAMFFSSTGLLGPFAIQRSSDLQIHQISQKTDAQSVDLLLTLSIILTIPKKFSDDTYKAKECILSIL